MKKFIAIAIAVLTVFSFTTVAFAENVTPNATTLTTSVPDAEYTLNIPADQEIPFGTEKTTIGVPTVSNTSGFAEGKNIQVDFVYTPFTCPDTDTTIPMSLSYSTGSDTYTFTQNTFIFKGLSSGSASNNPLTCATQTGTQTTVIGEKTVRGINITIYSSNWAKALAGDYSATITFTSEVVNGLKVR